MLGLIKKDIFVMAKRFQKIQLLIMMIVIIPASQFPDMALMLIGMVLAYLAVMLVSISFGYDVNSKWDEYVIVLPVDSGKIVLSKMLLGNFYMLMGMGIMTLIYAAGSLFHAFAFEKYAEAQAIIFIFCSLYNALQIPVIYRFGTEMGKYVFIIMLLLFYGMIALGAYFNVNLIELSLGFEAGSWAILFAGIMLFEYISFMVSKRIYEKRRKGRY
mgnify:CR=1 FL=1